MKPLLTERAQLIARLEQNEMFDLAIVGGGATGLGTALDAAARGLKVVLLEAHDFAKGTSSRSTKLVHGGVRYLAQGHLPLVWEALRERKRLLQNAPHLAHAMPFVMPAYRRFDQFFYGVGLKLYDILAGSARLGATQFLSRAETLKAVPGVKSVGLVGGVQYWDGQFDDARLALSLARTAASQGALLLNHMPVTRLLTNADTGQVRGLTCQDQETGIEHKVNARCVVNAAGVWVDQIEAMLQAKSKLGPDATAAQTIRPSQGVHLVVDASFWPGESALLVPHTQDGRVLFAVPWQGKVLLGTTDTPKASVEWEPQALEDEVGQILNETVYYLAKVPKRSDVTSVWAGLRPLANQAAEAPSEASAATQNVSREHTVKVGVNGLVTVTGGKWTTYRAMAADVMQSIRKAQLLSLSTEDVTANMPLWGAQALAESGPLPANGGHGAGASHSAYSAYGSDATALQDIEGAENWLAPHLSEAMVRFAARYEYARTVEDVLARRNRLLFLDASAALQAAPLVAHLLNEEIGRDPQLALFESLAKAYQLGP